MKKFVRDLDDYKTNQVFEWQVRRAALANGGAEHTSGPAPHLRLNASVSQMRDRNDKNMNTPTGGWP